MEKILRLFRYVDGVNDTPFPNAEEQVVIGDFEYQAARMGGSPSITATAMHRLCLDDLWDSSVYAFFNGEKYFVKNTPSSNKSNTDQRYSHELVMLSERDILSHVLFFDAVDQESGSANDKPKSNSTTVNFMGNIHEFAGRLRASLSYSGIDYKVDDSEVNSEDKLLSFKDKYIFEALQESFNVFEVPYYFVGKTIKFGFSPNVIEKPFKYGAENSLLSISKDNANFKLVNRITGVGSSDNLPYYYPNPTSKGTIDVSIPDTNKILTRNDVTIIDKTIFADLFPLTGVGKYERTTYNVPIAPKIYLKHDGEFIPYENNSDIEVTFEIYADLATANKNFKVEIDLPEDCIVFFEPKFEIYGDVTYKLGLETFDTPFSSGQRLSKGKHNILVGVSMQYPERNTDPQVDDYDYVSHFGSLNIRSIYSYTKDEWTLNGKVVDLESYGIRINKGKQYAIGDSFGQKVLKYITPSPNLMPTIYRISNGEQRFYNAMDGEYEDDHGGYYTFENLWSFDNPHEAVQDFTDIKPTIENVVNSPESGKEHINQFLEFAYDKNDNDELIEGTNEYQHPYFFAKLRRTDGPFGFNLFSAANEKRTMTISMTSGVCGACQFEIGVGEQTKKNIVQVDENGNLLYDKETGKVVLRAGSPQDIQNDTSKYETWIALKKDINTYKEYSPMPNVQGNFKPSPNDTFVILGITLPEAYILAAEDKLEKALIRFMYDNNREKFSFSMSFSRIFLEKNQKIRALLNEDARLHIEYNGIVYPLYVQDYTYKMNSNEPLPEISVTLADELVAGTNSLQQMLDGVKFEITDKILNTDIFLVGNRTYVRKDVDDFTNFLLSMYKGAKFGKYRKGHDGAYIDEKGNAEVESVEARKNVISDNVQSKDFLGGILGSGFALFKDAQGKSNLEVDNLLVRMKAAFTELEIDSLTYAGGNWIFSPAGAVCSFVEEVDNGYKCFITTSNGNKAVKNQFREGDIIHAKEFNISDNVSGNVKNRSWIRVCMEVGADYIILTKRSSGGTDIPVAGDSMVTLGHVDDPARQNAIIISAYGENAPSIVQYQGISTSIPLKGNEVTVISPKGNKFTGDFFLNDGRSVIDVTDGKIDLAIKNVASGGNNYYQSNSDIIFMYEKVTTEKAKIVSQDKRGFEILGIQTSYTEAILDTPFKGKGWYNVSFSASSRTNPVSFDVYVFFAGKDQTHIGKVNLYGHGRPTDRLSFPFEITEDTRFGIAFKGLGYEYYKFIDVKLEYGAKPTPWSPSEFDKDKDLLDTGINIKDKEITITANKFKVRANDGTKYIDVFKDKNGKPVIEAPNLDIDNISAINCKFVRGTMSGIFLRDATEITPQNMDFYTSILPDGTLVLNMDRVGNLSIFKGVFGTEELTINLPHAANTATLDKDSFRYIGAKILIINKSNIQLNICEGLVIKSCVPLYKNSLISLTCDVNESKAPEDNGFYIGWTVDYGYKLNEQSPFILE